MGLGQIGRSQVDAGWVQDKSGPDPAGPRWIAVRSRPNRWGPRRGVGRRKTWLRLFCIRRLRFGYGWRYGNFFCETLAKRVSDDLQLFIFRRRKNFLDNFFSKIFGVDFLFQKNEVLEELRVSFPRWHVRRKKLLPVVHLFLGRLPWWRGKHPNMCFWHWLSTKTDFNHLVLWCDDMWTWSVSYTHLTLPTILRV